MQSHAKLARKASHRSPKPTGIQSQRGAIAPPPTTLPPGALIDNVSQAAPTVQRDALEEQAAPVAVESEIHRAKGGGQTLDPQLQRSMGQAMGADFSHVKVHTDTTSDHLNHTLQAKAFTTGSDVFFRQGEYNPSSKGGQELIAHELTHVVQQGGASVQCQREPMIQRLGLSDASKHLTDPAADQAARANFIRDNFNDFWLRLQMDNILCTATVAFGRETFIAENIEIIDDTYHNRIGLPAVFDQYIPYDAPNFVNIGFPLRDRLIAQGRDQLTMDDIQEVLNELRGPVRDAIATNSRNLALAMHYINMSDAFGYGSGGGRERARGRGDVSAPAPSAAAS